jgi:predicted amidohydrolase
MENTIVACVQPRMSITATREEFETEARRYLRQAQAKSASLVIFPELMGVMLAPPLISSFKLGFIRREDEAKRPTAGFLRRRVGGVSGAAAGALGGGFRGSLKRLVRKNSDAYRELYLETFGNLAREYGTAIVGGSLYLYDDETDSIRHRAYVFDVNGDVLGYQDKFNLTVDEKDLATPGTDMAVVETRFGHLGLLIGRDALYPELARLLAIQGADLLAGIAASPGTAQASMVRAALGVRAEENQIFAAVSFMLGPNYLDRPSPEDYSGQSAVLAPISLTEKGDGLLVQTGTNRTEGFIAAELDAGALYALRQTSRFRPREEMHLGNLGPVLAQMYQDGLSIEDAINQRIAGPAEPEPEFAPSEPELLIEPEPEPVAGEVEPPAEPSAEVPEPETPSWSVPEALSITRPQEGEEAQEE